MGLLKSEAVISRWLGSRLAEIEIGDDLYDLTRPQPQETGDLFPCLEYFLPAVLAEVHPEWRSESFDGFLPIVARSLDQDPQNSTDHVS